MSKAYMALARKWRPARFSDIVGQAHIVRTLMNAITSQRVHHAYLFTGSRGIGKTSIARIFAKALQCKSREDLPFDQGGLRSCEECSSCKEISNGSSVDVIEIDGASNNGVDAVREIRENAKFLPASGERKIYIIDEVHMLTTSAFNALLKTLEEPPEHVLFIFATTEAHKIPATILSRVQRFDFKRVTISQIMSRLEQIIQSEDIQSEPAALSLICRAAEGSMRDALSLLDQVIAYSGSKLTLQSVRESIGWIESEMVFGILEAVLSKKPSDAIAKANEAYQKGHDLRVLTKNILEILHATLLCKVGVTQSQELELSTEEWEEVKKISDLRPLEEIELIFQVFHYGMDGIARSSQPKVLFDILIIKCATAEALVSLDNIQAPTPAPGTRKPSAAAPQPGVLPKSQSTPEPQPALQSKPAPPAPKSKPSVIQQQVEQVRAEAAANNASKADQLRKAITEGAPTTQTSAAPKKAQNPFLKTKPVSQTVAENSAPVQQTAPAPTPKPGQDKTWPNFVKFVKGSRRHLATLLEFVLDVEMDENVLVLYFKPEEVHKTDQLNSSSFKGQLINLIRAFYGNTVSFRTELKETETESPAERRARQAKEQDSAAFKAAESHPVIQEAKALFGAQVDHLQVTDPETGEKRVLT